jgi:hypothetical protein
MFFLAREIFSDERVSLLSALFLCLSPIHIARTAMPIPEALGILLFILSLLVLIRYLKTREKRYLLSCLLLLGVYVVSHRGWTLFILTALLLAVIYHADVFRKKRYLAGIFLLIAGAYMAVVSFFMELVMRINVEPVTALGYLKWVGITQLFISCVGIVLLYRSKDRIRIFLIIWFFLLMLMGSFSFRFRDPYGAIPASLLAGYGLAGILSAKVVRSRARATLICALLISLAIVQAFATSLYVIEHPSKGEIEALAWMRDNIPSDSVVLTWQEEGYYVIGISERKDITAWKRIYQGFFEEPPSVEETKQAYNDVFVMFRSAEKERMLELFNKYGIDYVYIDQRMRNELDALKFGLFELLGYDTYFMPVFNNGEAEIYEFLPDPMLPQAYAGPLTYPDYSSAAPTAPEQVLRNAAEVEKFWNGIAYLDRDDFRAYYPPNAKLAKSLAGLGTKADGGPLISRARWLIGWLSFEQLPDGSWTDQRLATPRASAEVTCQVAYELLEIGYMRPDLIAGVDLNKTADFLLSQYSNGWVRTYPSSLGDDYRTDAACLPAFWRIGQQMKRGEFIGAARQIASNVEGAQAEDGAWPYGNFSSRSCIDSQTMILYWMLRYYNLSGDEGAMKSISVGVSRLSAMQEEGGKLGSCTDPRTGAIIKTGIISYPRALFIYGETGRQEDADKTRKYMNDNLSKTLAWDLESAVQMLDVSP